MLPRSRLRRALATLAAAAGLAAGAMVGLPATSYAAGPGGEGTAGPSSASSPEHATVAPTRTGSRHAAAKARAKARADADTPLTVTIDSLSPSTIPARGEVTVTGTVTNTSDETWTDIHVYTFISADPLTTPTQLAEAAKTDPAAYLGDRITDPAGNYRATIETIAPGDTESYTVSVPRKALGATEPGVYWFGVHALGTSPEGTDSLADGRARTFLPLVPERETGSLPTSVVIPLRHQLVYADDGSVDDLAGWVRTLSEGGRLRSLVDLGASSGGDPVTWVVDPALVDAVRRLAAGNPPRSLAANLQPDQADSSDDDAPGEDSQGDPSDPADPAGTASGSPSDAPTAPPTDVPSPAPGQDDTSPLDLDDLDPVVQTAAEAAQGWLDRLQSAMTPDDQVLTLPYGDVDVASASVKDPQLLQRSMARSTAGLAGYDVPTAPAFSSPSGFLNESGLKAASPDTTVVMSDAELPQDDKALVAGHPAAITADGHRVLVASRGAAEGGPGPDDRMGVTAMRQRLLAEAAVRFLATGDEQTPLTLVVPHDWNPTDAASYFSGLRVPWLDLSTLDGVDRASSAVAVDAKRLRYPAWQAESELEQASFDAADGLVKRGIALQNLLTLNNIIAGTVIDQAMGTASYSARTRPLANRTSADRSRDWIDDRLGQVSITTPPAVTLTSSSGRFSATVVNNLDQPVTVALTAQTDDQLTIDAPQRIEIGAGRSASLLLTADTDENGVHDVRLMVTDKRGTPLGATTTLTIRSSQVSKVIWLFIGIGAALLFGAIAVRLFRRVRAARRTPPPAAATEAVDPGDPSHPSDPADPATREPAGAV